MNPNPDPPARQGDDDLLAAALAYHGRKWSVILIEGGTKKPAVRWKRYQRSRPSESTIRRWFAGRDDRAVAVVLGALFGIAVCSGRYLKLAATKKKLTVEIKGKDSEHRGDDPH